MTITLAPKYESALRALSASQELPIERVLERALAQYQLVAEGHATLTFHEMPAKRASEIESALKERGVIL